MSLAQSPVEMVGDPLSNPLSCSGLRLLQVAEPVMEPLGKGGWLVIHDSIFPSVM